MTKPKAIVCDLDMTLALIGDRDPYAGHLCHTDVPCTAVPRLTDRIRPHAEQARQE